MCGIAGILGRVNPPSERVLRAMLEAMAHRGPDGLGIHITQNMGLAQTRLAIIDLEGGKQPIVAPDGLAIAANGEIYNYIELKQELNTEVFQTNSDCEPPLPLYRRHGLDFVGKLRGMYAIALYDPLRQELILARDPFGIKPLYYAETAEGLVFASEISAILASGLVSKEENPEARDQLLALQFTCGRDTIFKGIKRVLPGEILQISGGEIKESQRISYLSTKGPSNISEEEAVSLFSEQMRQSVELHQRSDVPYGMFLSGGIDSSILLTLMDRLNPNPVLAFTLGFPGTSVHDERDSARALAKKTGAEHIQIEFTEQDFWETLPRVVGYLDDPTIDYAVLPTFKLAEEARKHVKVILSGEGGDELFAGYGRYRAAARPWPFRRPLRRNGAFDRLKHIFLKPPADWRAGLGIEKEAQWDRLQAAQAEDIANWLPNDLLIKLDRCLMAHGIEGRVPFLDKKIADLAFGLPPSLKIREGLGKWLPRLWLEENFPPARAFAKKKGFTVPVGEWIRKDAAKVSRLICENEGIKQFCKVKELEKLPVQQPDAAWRLLFYALWWEKHWG